jgi:hypothetical protein
MKIKFFLLATVALSFTQACSFSASSGSISTSSGSLSDSVESILSSPSSSSEDDSKDYQVQVMNYTNVYFSSAEFDSVTYSLGISELANAEGIANWEEDTATLVGIGKGLKKANITGRLYEAYKSSIASSEAKRIELIQKGYDAQD